MAGKEGIAEWAGSTSRDRQQLFRMLDGCLASGLWRDKILPGCPGCPRHSSLESSSHSCRTLHLLSPEHVQISNVFRMTRDDKPSSTVDRLSARILDPHDAEFRLSPHGSASFKTVQSPRSFSTAKSRRYPEAKCVGRASRPGRGSCHGGFCNRRTWRASQGRWERRCHSWSSEHISTSYARCRTKSTDEEHPGPVYTLPLYGDLVMEPSSTGARGGRANGSGRKKKFGPEWVEEEVTVESRVMIEEEEVPLGKETMSPWAWLPGNLAPQALENGRYLGTPLAPHP